MKTTIKLEIKTKNHIIGDTEKLYGMKFPYEGKYLLEEYLFPDHHTPQGLHSWSIARIHQNVD